MIKQTIHKLETHFEIEEVELPDNTDYASVVDYLIKTHTASVKYYKLIFKIGLFGLLFSLFLLLWLVGKNSSWAWNIFSWDWSIVFKVKEYPAVIASLITMSFGHLEMEEKKKELYKQLKNISTTHKDEKNDRETIVADYKKWTWSELQDKFKPE